MHGIERTMIALCVLGWLQSVAAEPATAPALETVAPVPPVAANAVTGSSSTAPTAATAPAAATTAAPSSATALLADQDKSLRSRGYRPETHGDTTIYCRKEAVVGSRFDKKVCGSADQLDATTQMGKDIVSDMQRIGNMGPRSN